MNNAEKHEMRLEKTHNSGAEEWYCPECGRRFLMQWPPTYKKIVLEVGDEHALHQGGVGDISVVSTDVIAQTDSIPDFPSHPENGLEKSSNGSGDLSQWREWLKGTGLNYLIED
jgi:hypothetical protein